jgi:hypothetical protein
MIETMEINMQFEVFMGTVCSKTPLGCQPYQKPEQQ